MISEVPRLRPQTATSLVERIAKEIKISILSGALRPGEQFSIAELCNEMGVSHIPVREALQRLEADGLVVLRPSRSAIVAPLSLEELAEIYQLRLRIEVDLVARSAASYTTEQLHLAASICEELTPSSHGPGGSGSLDAHKRFHEVLLGPATGQHGSRIMWRLWDAADRYIRLVYDARPVGPEERYRRHHELLVAAQQRRGPIMRKALSEHLNRSSTYMLNELKELLEAGTEGIDLDVSAGADVVGQAH
jgi:DNA-binding GntR family transcriptional regulator